MKQALFVLVFALLCAIAPPAAAHGARTAYVEVVELAAGGATLHLRLNVPEPSLAFTTPAGCTLEPLGEGASPFDRSARLACAGGLAGKRLELAGLGPIVTDAVAWISYADGTSESAVLRPAQPFVDLRRVERPLDVARAYVGLGIRHIATGYDHLLFLALLCLWLGDARRVILAETAFTVSHSLSFSATALGWVHVSSAAAEACIALSLLLLAFDAQQRGARLPGRLAGAAMAFLFGLVHGLGFAGGLHEIGVPDRAAGVALLGFGVGIELGQIAFLAVVLAALHTARAARVLPKTTLAAVYAAGGVSAYWLFDRLYSLVLVR